MALKRASTSSWSTEGGGVTNSSPRMTSYLLPSSGRRCSSSSVHALAGIDNATEFLSSRNECEACVEDTPPRHTRRHRIIAPRCEGRHLHATLGARAESIWMLKSIKSPVHARHPTLELSTIVRVSFPLNFVHSVPLGDN